MDSEELNGLSPFSARKWYIGFLIALASLASICLWIVIPQWVAAQRALNQIPFDLHSSMEGDYTRDFSPIGNNGVDIAILREVLMDLDPDAEDIDARLVKVFEELQQPVPGSLALIPSPVESGSTPQWTPTAPVMATPQPSLTIMPTLPTSTQPPITATSQATATTRTTIASTGTFTPTRTSSPTATRTATVIFTALPSLTPTLTSVITSTYTPSPPPTHTGTVTFTPTATQSPTSGPTSTSTVTSTSTASATFSPTATHTPTPTHTTTHTPTQTPTQSPSATPTHTPTPSDTPLPTHTFTATPTSSGCSDPLPETGFVLSISPANGSTAINVDSNVIIQFNQSMRRTSLIYGDEINIVLCESDSNNCPLLDIVLLQLSVENNLFANDRVVLNPLVNLDSNHTYYLTVGNQIRNACGTNQGLRVHSSFTTSP